MSQIIALPPSRGSVRQAPAGGSAEILFFMGVRYRRMTDEEFAEATAVRSRHVDRGRQSKSHVARRHS